MNPRIARTLTDEHLRDLRTQAAAARASRHHQPAAGGQPARPVPALRQRIGFALVEAGFHVLGSTRLARPE
jgi:hypothetical protein